MAVSAVQSALFNDWVTARLDEGLGRVALLGDVLKKTDTGGLFNVTEDDDLEVERNRLASLQTVVTGPMFGTRMREATHVSGQREADVLARAGLALSRFEAVSKVAQGTRRPLYVFPEGLDARVMDDGFEIAFSLPAGAYATVLLRELVAELESGEDAATAAESPADSESTDE
jgi:tRNA pseudouridine13 synthase